MAKKRRMSKGRQIFWVVILTILYGGAIVLDFYNHNVMGAGFWEDLQWVLVLQLGWNLLVLTLLYGSLLFVIFNAGKIRELEEAEEDKREDVLTIMERFAQQEKQDKGER